MRVHIKSKYTDDDVALEFRKYGNGVPAILGFTLEGEPLFTATVALEQKPADGCVMLKGWSENIGIPQALEDAGVVELTGRKFPTGYVEAEEAKLLIEN